GTYAPSGVADAPVSLAGSFGGASTQGTWTLFMSDAAQGDIGSITGWGISFSSGAAIPEPGSLALLGAMGLACIVRRRR
ncbi:MAG: PEP-CTERM sorting domain-containing protein, partial [Pirellulaceae bacterium]|nr:PEP-CTERM sorting domain-containing protein [Pirellulaceae bacterium]